MRILTQALFELLSPDSAARSGDEVSTLGGWEVIKRHHSLVRNTERESEDEIDILIERVVKRLNQMVQRITRTGEYMFFSKSLNRAAVCNVDTKVKQLRIVTILPKGKEFAKPGTIKVIIEGIQYEIIEID